MFGQMMIEPIVQVDPNADLQAAVTGLTKITEAVEIVRWIELPAVGQAASERDNLCARKMPPCVLPEEMHY